MSTTSIASSAALRSLQATSKAMAGAQTRISTGLKVNQASDDPLAWSVSQQLRGSIKSNDTYKVGLADAVTRTKLTTNALGQIDKSLRAIRVKVDEWSAGDATKKSAVETEIANLQKDIVDAVASAKYNGTSWLENTTAITIASGPSTTISIAAPNQIAGAAGIIAANSLKNATLDAAVNRSLLTFGSGTLTEEMAQLKTGLDGVIAKVGIAQANFGAAQDSIETRQTFLTDMNGILSGQLSELVDADLDEESSKLSALQVRQQLAMTALSIINQSQMNILRLFQ